MAKRRGAGAGKKPMAAIFTVFWLFTIAGGLLAFAKVNSIHSPGELYDYAKSWSDKADECYGDDPEEELWKCSGSTKPGETPPLSNDGVATELPQEEFDKLTKELAAIPVKDSANVSYDRGDWKHWSDLDKNKCDTREDVLLAQGKNVKKDPSDACKAVSGLWVSVYEDKEFTNPRSLDIDHIIPLNYAAQHGGATWPAAKKEAFANDFSQLLAVSAHENRSKSDKGPGEYMPPDKTYWCSYAQTWISTATKYSLWIESADKTKLEEALGTC